MAYTESTTVGELHSLVAKVIEENDIFILGKKRVAKAFLQSLLDLAPETGYGEVEAAYRQSASSPDIPDDAEDFWAFIEKNYLYLEMEPKDVFFEVSLQVIDDLGKIDKNLRFITSERTTLEEKKRSNGRLDANERYYRNQLDYFEDKNLTARSEIVEFMTKGIKPHALNRSATRAPFDFAPAFFFKDCPYSFGRKFIWSSRDPYDVKSLDEYSHKFNDLPVSDHRELVEACRASPERFKEVAHWYIAGDGSLLPSIREKLEGLTRKSHIIARRKKVIETMLRHFDDKDYISFVSIAPLQVEGIFADICREVGVSENQLDISSLNDKLQHIDGRLNSFFYFEYYSFKFPVLRNSVAHGGLVDGDLEETALHLMLDLWPVCELAVSKEIPINHALSVLDAASKRDYKKLVEWIELRGRFVIPEFYDVSSRIAATEALCKSTEFWDYLVEELRKLRCVEEVRKSMPVKIAGIIKSQGIAKDEADKFLRSSSEIVRDATKKRNEGLELIRSKLGMLKR